MKPHPTKPFPAPTTGAVDCMTTAPIPDCRFTAAHAPLWALVEAQAILRRRAASKVRLAVVAAAMKRRYHVVSGSDATLVKKRKR